MRDTRFRMAAAGEVATEKQKASYKARGDALVQKLKGLEAAEVLQRKCQQPKKMQRLATWEVLHGLNWQLGMLGIPLSAFMPQEREEREFHLRPHLSIISDTGSDMFCMGNFLANHRKMRVTFIGDVLHRLWRAVWNATTEAHLYLTSLIVSVILNYEHGPFQNQMFFQQEKEAAAEFMAMVEEDDPLCLWLAPMAARDRALSSEPEKSVVATALSSLQEARWLERKGPRVAPTRWGTVHNGLAELLEVWHEKLLVLLSFGLMEGWLCNPTQQKGSLSLAN